MFYKKAVLKNFAIFTRKHLCWGLFVCKQLLLESAHPGTSGKRTITNSWTTPNYRIRLQHTSKTKATKAKSKNNKQHQKSLNESHKSSRSRNKIFILGDNIIKHFQGWEISKKIKHVLNRYLLSTKVMYTKDSPNLA